MNIFQYFKEARITIKGNALRSFLSILGIVIGIFAVIVMLAIGKGAEKQLMDQLGELAKNQIQIYQGWNDGAKPTRFNLDLVNYLEQVFPELEGKVSYQSYGSSELKSTTSSSSSQGGRYTSMENNWMQYYGVPISWFENNDRELSHGSFFIEQQYDRSDAVVIINRDLYERLFEGKNPIGEKIELNKKLFAVVGVVKNLPRESGYEWKNYEAWIPYPTMAAKFPQNAELSSLTIYLPAMEDNKHRQDRISYVMLKYYNIYSLEEASFEVDSFSKYIDEMKEQQKMMNYLLLAIGSISLLVGGIGVMNIMLVSVTERTKEIGIRKAVGALKRDIILQFLIEAIVITLIGGILAIILSYGAEFLINRYGEAMNLHALITPDTVGLALIITSLTGILFGILPARRAARMQVIDALRYE
ncbi:MAG: ABC transporter permease [Candidatus Absconditabacteria bacterium]|nr:ABC transporter permease [Candidatus Absconditabacteria bacterium]